MHKLNRLTLVRLLQYVEHLGFSAKEICKSADYDCHDLLEGGLNLTHKGIDHVWRTVVQATNQPEIGFHLGLHLDTDATGVVGMIIQNATTVEQAIIAAKNYSEILSKVVTISYTRNEDTFTITLNPDTLLSSKYPTWINQICLMSFGMALKFYESITLKRVELIQVSMPRLIKNRTLTKAFCNSTIADSKFTYSGMANCKFLDQKTINPDFETMRILSKRAQLLITTERNQWTARIEAKLTNQRHGLFLSLNEIAAELNIGERTLQRKLRKEQTSYLEVLNRIKKSVAIMTLHETKSIKDTSYILGFSTPASFSKAFTKWTGQNPSSYLKTGVSQNSLAST